MGNPVDTNDMNMMKTVTELEFVTVQTPDYEVKFTYHPEGAEILHRKKAQKMVTKPVEANKAHKPRENNSPK